MKPQRGAVYLDGQSIHQLPTKLVDRQLAVLPQRPEAPDGLEVRELVAYGRFLILIGNEIVKLPAAGFLARGKQLVRRLFARFRRKKRAPGWTPEPGYIAAVSE